MPTTKDRSEYQRQYYLKRKDELLKKAEEARIDRKKEKDERVIEGCKMLVSQMMAWIEKYPDHEQRASVQDALAILVKCLCIIHDIEVPPILNIRHSKHCLPDQGNW